ncbi:MAG: hypothetical protein JSV39_01880 [Candidatus Aenigmatarchaeota archaeon]|nr:MAG: hypothetical protein JSV39_01880 [Candidatus Aenigmarchaeota archaeon]
MLGISALGIAVVGYDLLRSSFVSFYAAAQIAASEGADMIAEKSFGANGATQAFPQLPYLHILGFLVFGILLAVSLLYLKRSRLRVRV